MTEGEGPTLPLPEADDGTSAEVKDWLARFAACVREVDYAAAYPFWHEGIVIFGTYQELVRSRRAWTRRTARPSTGRAGRRSCWRGSPTAGGWACIRTCRCSGACRRTATGGGR